MAKIITTDFGTIHDALNKLIIGEVKAAIRLLSDKEFMTTDSLPLCRLVVSSGGDYAPVDLGVRRVWLDKDGDLHFSKYTAEEDLSGVYDYTEDDDMLDITDFQYLIAQIHDELPDREQPYDLTTADDMEVLNESLSSSKMVF